MNKNKTCRITVDSSRTGVALREINLSLIVIALKIASVSEARAGTAFSVFFDPFHAAYVVATYLEDSLASEFGVDCELRDFSPKFGTLSYECPRGIPSGKYVPYELKVTKRSNFVTVNLGVDNSKASVKLGKVQANKIAKDVMEKTLKRWWRKKDRSCKQEKAKENEILSYTCSIRNTPVNKIIISYGQFSASSYLRFETFDVR